MYTCKTKRAHKANKRHSIKHYQLNKSTIEAYGKSSQLKMYTARGKKKHNKNDQKEQLERQIKIEHAQKTKIKFH